jgi:hypothetical protein
MDASKCWPTRSGQVGSKALAREGVNRGETGLVLDVARQVVAEGGHPSFNGEPELGAISSAKGVVLLEWIEVGQGVRHAGAVGRGDEIAEWRRGQHWLGGRWTRTAVVSYVWAQSP